MDTEIKVLALPPVQAVVTDLAEVFRQETGHTVTLTFRASGFIRQKLAAGEPADVIILTDTNIDELEGQGVVAAGTRTNIARVCSRYGSDYAEIRSYFGILRLAAQDAIKRRFNCVWAS